jgi:RNA polymerase sigma-70 factor, ECF subfamily
VPTPADLTSVFEAQRPRLMGLGYRMLGTVTDAEDIVQEAWLRWQRGDRSDVDNPEAYLTTVTTRLALDRLRQLKAQREVYPGAWLPEPVAVEDPAATVERRESLSLAVLVLLETLSPLERAAFVLHDVFERPYAEIATILGREEAATRQLVSRARRHIEAGRPRYPADHAQRDKVVQQFLAAVTSADPGPLLSMLAPSVAVVSDGGGVAPAPLRVVSGRDKVARLLLGIVAKASPVTTFSFEVFNAELGIVARQDGPVISALALAVTTDGISTLYLMANPNKLGALGPDHRAIR